MNLDHVRYFAELARHQHIQKTAKRLNISPTAISHGIARLEEELGFSLTTKAGRNILLTDKGLEFARRMEGILRQLDGVKEELSGDRVLPGTYTLALTHGLLGLLADEASVCEMARGEGVSVEISSLRSADVVQAVAEGSVDLGICYSPQAHPSLRTRELRRGQLVFVARKEHPAHRARGAAARLRALADSPAIGTKAFQGIENCERHPVFTRLKLRPDYRLVVDSYESMLALLRESDTWAFVPDVLLAANRDWLRTVDVGPAAAPYTIEAVWNKDRKPPLLYRQLLDRITAGAISGS
jgi:DNA-binding transcriptional LysR family regulator